uniref:Phosphoinositide phospholipase C n=1 Tax=Hippocampus comes TaxID=109280 RepID=A0A3Q2XGN6_HIPCM
MEANGSGGTHSELDGARIYNPVALGVHQRTSPQQAYRLEACCNGNLSQSESPIFPHAVSVDDIDSVRNGRQSEGLNKHTDPGDEERCFSIVFKGRKKVLDLMASDRDEADQWVKSFEKVLNNLRNLSRQQKSEHWIIDCMRRADKNADNKMNLKELKRFLRHVNIEVDDAYAEELFRKCDRSESGYLEDSEIETFYELLTHREEIDVIYGNYARTEGQMSVRDLLDFLLNEQRESATASDALGLMEKYEMDKTAKQNKRMSKDGFQMYLQHEDCSILNPAHKSVYQDMTQPLNHYYISSSHNTYLTHDQLKGPSSTEGYIRALMKNCRCVELDSWDGPNGEPVIYHGYTLTSKILFRDAIRAIKDYAFRTSDYPVILSLENHCSLEQQKLMAHYIISILGDALVTEPLGDFLPAAFPSPEELKGKFLIKGKCLNKLSAAFNDRNNTISEGTVSEEDEAAEQEDGQKSPQKKSKIRLARELSDVVVYCKSVHFNGFEHARDKLDFNEMSSFKESKAFNLAESASGAFTRHNVDKLSRTYPAGSRTDSSNYNPVPMWNAGCQIGAPPPLGRPPASRRGAQLPDARQGDPPCHGRVVKRVISAQQLPKLNVDKQKSIVDPLVRVEVYGVRADNASKETHRIDNNGFNPTWNEHFEFDVHVPELAILRLVVEDYDATSANDLIGQYCLPLTCVQNGYRHVPLLNKNGDLISAAGLFVHVMLLDAE